MHPSAENSHATVLNMFNDPGGHQRREKITEQLDKKIADAQAIADKKIHQLERAIREVKNKLLEDKHQFEGECKAAKRTLRKLIHEEAKNNPAIMEAKLKQLREEHVEHSEDDVSDEAETADTDKEVEEEADPADIDDEVGPEESQKKRRRTYHRHPYIPVDDIEEVLHVDFKTMSEEQREGLINYVLCFNHGTRSKVQWNELLYYVEDYITNPVTCLGGIEMGSVLVDLQQHVFIFVLHAVVPVELTYFEDMKKKLGSFKAQVRADNWGWFFVFGMQKEDMGEAKRCFGWLNGKKFNTYEFKMSLHKRGGWEVESTLDKEVA